MLFNKINRKELKILVQNETFKRITLSFYRYIYINEPQVFRDELYQKLHSLNCFGRIYIANEGINAQMSVPEHEYTAFLELINEFVYLENIPIKKAIGEDGKSFFVLDIKLKNKLVADGLPDHSFDVTNVGTHLDAAEFNQAMAQKNTVVVDMRNFYESEIGHFENAIRPNADSFREELPLTLELLKDQEEHKILLYCTGGIRCEKASAYLKHHGFKDVNQLYGGIINYTQQVSEQGLENKFRGKNFVFDERLGEKITAEIVAKCHQCAQPADQHRNCANDYCHILFVQCANCAQKYENCCSAQCKDFWALTPEQRKLSYEDYTFSGNRKNGQTHRPRLPQPK